MVHNEIAQLVERLEKMHRDLMDHIDHGEVVEKSEMSFRCLHCFLRASTVFDFIFAGTYLL